MILYCYGQVSTTTCKGVIQWSSDYSSQDIVDFEVLQCGSEPYLWNLLYLLHSEDKNFLLYGEVEKYLNVTKSIVNTTSAGGQGRSWSGKKLQVKTENGINSSYFEQDASQYVVKSMTVSLARPVVIFYQLSGHL